VLPACDTSLRIACWLGAVGLALTAFFAATPAHADERASSLYVAAPRPSEMTERSGFSFDVRLCVGAARAEFTESDYPVADFDAVAVGGALRFGWFFGQHVLLGAELSGGWRGGVGTLSIHDPGYFSGKRLPDEASYGMLVPLGVFVEVYPMPGEGVYASLAGGVGFLDLPRFSHGGGGLLSGFSLELGYELSRAAKVGPAPFLRYSRWAGEESPIASEHPDGLLSREVLVGLRWSFWTPDWR
jgi:hypothetical protein